jgi:hypothetical protein
MFYKLYVYIFSKWTVSTEISCNGAQISGTNTTRLVGHMECINQAAQAYVMIGRIQWISQLYLSSFDAVKIKINQEALSEAYRLKFYCH